MKILKASAICVLFSICYFSSSAQDELFRHAAKNEIADLQPGRFT
jgi:hypothetical protein